MYSPKLAKLLEVIQDNDNTCQQTNPEKESDLRLRKRMIFCEDMHAIRAVAGGLTAQGWTFGMKRSWVRWKKTYYNMETNKQIGKEISSKGKQLTWLPSREGDDYKRFLILTRSKIGGISGATLNEYSIQKIGAKDEEATYNHIDNARGRDYRIIIIDRNFVEGIDLPSTYCDLFDSVLSQSTRTQIVGRVSRFCGSNDLPFVENYGWPQTVYRYGLKFHTNGIHLAPSQAEKLQEKVNDPRSLFAAIIPEPYREGFLSKVEHNLFSPVELQVLLDDNMEIQRVKKKTLDVYLALLEKVSIGSLLYQPAMRNLQVARTELEELLLEEEETENEYKQEILNRDKQQKAKVAYALRSQKRQLMDKWQFDDGPIFSLVSYHVNRAIHRTAIHDIGKWKNEEERMKFFHANIKPDLNDAEYITIAPQTVINLMNEMFKEKTKVKEKLLETKIQKQDEKAQKLEFKDTLNHINETIKGGKRSLRKLNDEGVEKLWNAVTLTMPAVNRITFDRVIAKCRVQRTSSKKRTTSNKSRSKKPKKEIPSDKPKKEKKPKPPKNAVDRALEKAKKDLKLDIRKIRKSKPMQEQLIQAVGDKFPKADIEAGIVKLIS